MNKYPKLFLFMLTPIIAASCIGTVTKDSNVKDQYSLQRNNSTELLDLLQTLTSTKAQDSESDNIHINWSRSWQSGFEKFDDYGKNFTYSSIGTMHMTMDSAFTGYYTRKRNFPVPWKLHMYGGRAIYLTCLLKTDTTGGNGGFVGIDDYLRKKKLLLESTCFKYKEKLMSHDEIPDFRLCKIKLPNNKIIYALLMTLIMNNVTDQALYFNSDGSKNIPFPEDFKSFYQTDKSHTCTN